MFIEPEPSTYLLAQAERKESRLAYHAGTLRSAGARSRLPPVSINIWLAGAGTAVLLALHGEPQ